MVDPFSSTASGFGPEGKKILDFVMTDKSFRGRIAAAEVGALMKAESVTREGLMLKLIPVAKGFAHPPISNYFVGAVLSGASGSLYLGANIELPPNVLSLSVHAEQAAVANAFMSNEEGIEALAVGAAPCGHCRQFLSEISPDASMRVILQDESSIKLADVLPHSFGPRNLGLSEGSFPVRRANLSLAFASGDALVREALDAARMAYSPYSHSRSGVALLTATGRVFAGSYIENAAYNPSLPPLQAALAGYFAAGKGAGTIQRAVLVEGDGATISQEVTARASLSALAPGVQIERHPCKAS